MSKKATLNMVVPPELAARLKEREDTYLPSAGRRGEVPAEAARKSLSRYFRLIEDALTTVELTEAEANLVCEALNGTAVWDWGCLGEFSSGNVLRIQLADAVNPEVGNFAAKCGVDGELFLAKVGQWNELQCLAVVDAAERFWAGDNQGFSAWTVGLVRA